MKKMHEEMRKNLPEDARAALMKAMKEAKQKMADRKTEEASKSGIPPMQMMGKMIVIGPDGKKQEFNFSEGNAGAIQLGSGHFRGLQFHPSQIKESLESKSEGKSISSKLDLILERLEKLESRVDELSKE